MVVEAAGLYKYPDKGNMTKAEIDLTMKVLTEAKKSGQFRAFWKDFNESVNLMASGETVGPLTRISPVPASAPRVQKSGAPLVRICEHASVMP